MGGGSPSTTTTTVDPVYNAGMLQLSQQQQGWAAEMYNQFKYGVPYDPNEKVTGYTDASGKFVQSSTGAPVTSTPTQGQGNRTTGPGAGLANDPMNPNNPIYGGRLASQTGGTTYGGLETRTRGEIEGYDANAQTSEMEYLQNLVNSNQELLGLQTDVSKQQLGLQQEQIGAQRELLPLATGAAKQRFGLATTFMNDVNAGINVNERMNQAQAGVQHGFKNARAANDKNVFSYGLDPNSSMFASSNKDLTLAEASGVAGARTGAKVGAEAEDFQRKKDALGLQI